MSQCARCTCLPHKGAEVAHAVDEQAARDAGVCCPQLCAVRVHCHPLSSHALQNTPPCLLEPVPDLRQPAQVWVLTSMKNEMRCLRSCWHSEERWMACWQSCCTFSCQSRLQPPQC